MFVLLDWCQVKLINKSVILNKELRLRIITIIYVSTEPTFERLANKQFNTATFILEIM